MSTVTRPRPSDEVPAVRKASDFASPTALCDVVMKGGITSGVVYPLALCDLAATYRFKNLGGTSAGAIAAAAAAAAEYGRIQGRGGEPFVELSRLPTELAKRLPTLFQPTRHTRPLFALGVAFVSDRSITARCRAILVALVFAHPLFMLLGLAPGALVALWTLYAFAGLAASDVQARIAGGTAVVLALAFAIAGGILAPAFRSLRLAYTRTLKENDYGLCTGMTVGRQEAALTPWLSDLFNRLAGKAPGTFLTFGDLWAAGESGSSIGPRGDGDDRAINLEMMTTNLSSGRPHRLPKLDGTFRFKESEWLRLFPKELVASLTAGKTATNGMYDLPDEAALPVVVAVRMSLSFPGLLSAVPLYGVEHTSEGPGANATYVHSWFSDGGLISNFPIHLFDRVWPRWPTFGFNLCARTDREEPWRPKVGDPLEDSFAPISSLSEFAGAILNAMQNWSDNLQSLLPGYRERIVHIPLAADQGGLNLEMSGPTILELSKRGARAAACLKNFEWEEHRWTRFVSSVHEFRDVLDGMACAYHGPSVSGSSLVPLGEFLKGFDVASAGFSATDAWRKRAVGAAEALVGVFVMWDERIAGPKPQPAPELRISPRF